MGFAELRKCVTSSASPAEATIAPPRDGDRVRSMARLHDVAPGGFDDNGVHGAERSATKSTSWNP